MHDHDQTQGLNVFQHDVSVEACTITTIVKPSCFDNVAVYRSSCIHKCTAGYLKKRRNALSRCKLVKFRKVSESKIIFLLLFSLIGKTGGYLWVTCNTGYTMNTCYKIVTGTNSLNDGYVTVLLDHGSGYR